MTVSREPSGKYFVSLLFYCENQTAEKRPAEKFIGIDFASSKICSVCGKKKEELSLSDRIYYCECGHRMDRDVNAAVNIMNEGKRIFAECA